MSKKSEWTYAKFKEYFREQLVQNFIERGFRGIEGIICEMVMLHSQVIKDGGWKEE